MREIKFKYIFRDANGEFHTLTLFIADIEEHLDIPFNIDAGWELVARCEWTGLKGSKDREIFGGDILDCDVGGRYLKVIWFEPQACFDTVPIKVFNENFVGLANNEWKWRCKVIGNIYENPDLIGG